MELKPCPCGTEAVICKPLEDITGWVIRCAVWGCFEMGLPHDRSTKMDLDGLIHRWNTRQNAPEPAECNCPVQVECKNPRQSKSIVVDLYRSDLDDGCEKCHFFYGKMEQHWRGDVAKCQAPMEISYGDKYDYYPARYIQVRKCAPEPAEAEWKILPRCPECAGGSGRNPEPPEPPCNHRVDSYGQDRCSECDEVLPFSFYEGE